MGLIHVTSQPQWQSLAALESMCSSDERRIFAKLHSLLTVESLTQGLEALDPRFSVNLIALSDTYDYYADTHFKPIQLCRKVTLQLSGQAVVYAESLCDTDALEWTQYLNCGAASLGRRLFSADVKIERSAFSYALFSSKTLPFEISLHLPQGLDTPIFARRSYFTMNGKSLFITEWYLPSIIEDFINL